MKSNSIVVKRVFNLSKRELFDAWSKPAIMSRWFFASTEQTPHCSVENNFVTQGSYKLTMHFEQNDVVIHGKYLEINRFNLISFSWNNPLVSNSQVTLRFKDLSPNRTELTLTHILLPDQSACDAHFDGWNKCFDNLEKLQSVSFDAENENRI